MSKRLQSVENIRKLADARVGSLLLPVQACAFMTSFSQTASHCKVTAASSRALSGGCLLCAIQLVPCSAGLAVKASREVCCSSLLLQVGPLEGPLSCTEQMEMQPGCAQQVAEVGPGPLPAFAC